MTNKNLPLISVVIPNHNYGEFLKDAILSILAQDYPKVEIIVVDNGSTDESKVILESFEPKIRCIFQENLGQAFARNRGIKESKGELIALMDSDDIWNPDKLSKQFEIITSEAQLVYCGMQVFEDLGQDRIYHEELRGKFKGDCKFDFVRLFGPTVVLGGESTALFTRELYKKVGRLDESLSAASGWDFFRRASLYTNFDFNEEPLVLYRRHNSNFSKKLDTYICEHLGAYQKALNEPASRQGFVQAFLKLTFLRLIYLRLAIKKHNKTLFKHIFYFHKFSRNPLYNCRMYQ